MIYVVQCKLATRFVWNFIILLLGLDTPDILCLFQHHLALCMMGNLSCFFLWIFFFLNQLFQKKKKIFQEYYQSVKQFGFRAGPTFCRAWSGSKLFANVISRWQKLPLAGKELSYQWWRNDNERLCAMKSYTVMRWILPLVGFEPRTLWSEVRSAQPPKHSKDTLGRFSINLNMEDNFYEFLFAFLAYEVPSEKGSTLKGKNLLP